MTLGGDGSQIVSHRVATSSESIDWRLDEACHLVPHVMPPRADFFPGLRSRCGVAAVPSLLFAPAIVVDTKRPLRERRHFFGSVRVCTKARDRRTLPR